MGIASPGAAAFGPGKTDHHDLRENEETGDFRARGDKRGAGDRRPFIGIRRPEVKWNSGDFEPEADHRHDHGEDEYRVDHPVQTAVAAFHDLDGLFTGRLGDFSQVGRVRNPIEQT